MAYACLLVLVTDVFEDYNSLPTGLNDSQMLPCALLLSE